MSIYLREDGGPESELSDQMLESLRHSTRLKPLSQPSTLSGPDESDDGTRPSL